MDRIAMARQRPGMYVGSDGPAGVTALVLEPVGNAVDLHLAGRCTRVDVAIDADGTITVEDDGPGFPREGPARLSRVLTEPSDRATVDGHAPHVHLARGLGLFVVSALSEAFELVTVRDGQQLVARTVRGALQGPIVASATTAPNGTRVRFRPDPLVFEPCAPHVRVLFDRLDDLSALLPGLRVSMSTRGFGVDGLAGVVARTAECAIDEVAHHRGTFDTDDGPIDVEVALVYLPYRLADGPRIDCFANLVRNVRGTHADGVRDALAEVFPARTDQDYVAAVAVITSDVRFGAPTRDELITPGARQAVANATIAALWAHAAAAVYRGSTATMRPRGWSE